MPHRQNWWGPPGSPSVGSGPPVCLRALCLGTVLPAAHQGASPAPRPAGAAHVLYTSEGPFLNFRPPLLSHLPKGPIARRSRPVSVLCPLGLLLGTIPVQLLVLPGLSDRCPRHEPRAATCHPPPPWEAARPPCLVAPLALTGVEWEERLLGTPQPTLECGERGGIRRVCDCCRDEGRQRGPRPHRASCG